jgi:alpha-N-arabinofuranosidase
MHWTTPSGYVDRLKRFSQAMLTADPTIRLYSCGAPAMWGDEWNGTLVRSAASFLGTITDHPLIGGNVPPSTEPLDVFRDFMAVPEALAWKWTALRDSLSAAGIADPRLAVTELQLFAHLGTNKDPAAPVRLRRDNFPNQASMTEAMYDVLIYHAAVRLAPFVEMITHSATVNHGGGLRKERERVWGNPCHDAQAAFAAFADATPVGVEIEAALRSAPLVLPDLRHVTNRVSFSAVDALAALGKDGSLLLSFVHRETEKPIHLTIELAGFKPAAAAELHLLSAPAPWTGNTLDQPTAIQPTHSTLQVQGAKLELELPPYSVGRLKIPGSL